MTVFDLVTAELSERAIVGLYDRTNRSASHPRPRQRPYARQMIAKSRLLRLFLFIIPPLRVQFSSFTSRSTGAHFLSLDALKRLLDQANVSSKRSFELVHARFVLLEIVVVVAFEVVGHPAESAEVQELEHVCWVAEGHGG